MPGGPVAAGRAGCIEESPRAFRFRDRFRPGTARQAARGSAGRRHRAGAEALAAERQPTGRTGGAERRRAGAPRWAAERGRAGAEALAAERQPTGRPGAAEAAGEVSERAKLVGSG